MKHVRPLCYLHDVLVEATQADLAFVQNMLPCRGLESQECPCVVPLTWLDCVLFWTLLELPCKLINGLKTLLLTDGM